MKLLHLNQLTGRAQFFVGRGSDKPRVLISETGLVTVTCRTSPKPKASVSESGLINGDLLMASLPSSTIFTIAKSALPMTIGLLPLAASFRATLYRDTKSSASVRPTRATSWFRSTELPLIQSVEFRQKTLGLM
jgi:hypothetical protein